MKSSSIRSMICGHAVKIAVIPLLTVALCLAGFGLTSNSANAQIRKSDTAAVKKSDDELKAIAVAAVPGKAIDVAIERKLGANRYVVEVLSTKDGGAEVDVIIDMDTYKVLGLDK